MMTNSPLRLLKDCRAARIPSGEEVVLEAGREFVVAQALGGSVTLRSEAGLFRVGREEAAALGPEIAGLLAAEENAGIAGDEFSEDKIRDALRQCFDPEIPINIVDLGLIYSLACRETGAGNYHVDIKMTLTATGCGMGPTIAADAREKVLALPFIETAEVEIVWDPQWNPNMISEEGRKILGLN